MSSGPGLRQHKPDADERVGKNGGKRKTVERNRQRQELLKKRLLPVVRQPKGAPPKTKDESIRERFLKALALGWSVTYAANAANLGYRTVHKMRQDDPEFAAAWANAVEQAKDRTLDEVKRRAIDGVLEPVYHQGAVVGEIRKYSDTLLALKAKAEHPQYNTSMSMSLNKTELSGPGGAPIQLNITKEEAEQRLKELGLDAKVFDD